MKIGLGLGGGGARGLVHIGILQVLNDHRIPISSIAGTSAGAIVGAMYAATKDPVWIKHRFQEFFKHKVFKNLGTDRMIPMSAGRSPLVQFAQKVRDRMVIALSMQKMSIVKKSRLKDAISFLLPVATFGELLIPLKVTATDLVSSNTIIYSEGDLIEAVVQSSSIPGFVEPTIDKNSVIIDGGIGMPNPVNLLSSEAEFLISADIKKELSTNQLDLNIYDILSRSEEVSHYQLSSELAQKANFVIRPEGMHYHWSEFYHMDSLIEKGKTITEKNIQLLKKEIADYFSIWSRIKRKFSMKMLG